MSQPAHRDPLGPPDEAHGWLRALTSTGSEREDALERLHALLLGAARFELARRRAPGGEGLDDLAMHAADDALVALMPALHTYRGDSRFTTWASKFAIVETGVKLRRRRWHGRDLPPEADGWLRLLENGRGASPDGRRRIAAVRAAAEEQLAPHERAVLVAIALNGVPIDVLAERRGTTRAEVYAQLHEAQRKLRDLPT